MSGLQYNEFHQSSSSSTGCQLASGCSAYYNVYLYFGVGPLLVSLFKLLACIKNFLASFCLCQGVYLKSLFVYTCLHGTGPSNLSEFLQRWVPDPQSSPASWTGTDCTLAIEESGTRGAPVDRPRSLELLLCTCPTDY